MLALDMHGNIIPPVSRFFKDFWVFLLVRAAILKANTTVYRGHQPRYLGRRAHARALGYHNHEHMLIDEFQLSNQPPIPLRLKEAV